MTIQEIAKMLGARDELTQEGVRVVDGVPMKGQEKLDFRLNKVELNIRRFLYRTNQYWASEAHTFEQVMDILVGQDTPEGKEFWQKCKADKALSGHVFIYNPYQQVEDEDKEFAQALKDSVSGIPFSDYNQVALKVTSATELQTKEFMAGSRWTKIKIGRGLKKAYPFATESQIEQAVNKLKAAFAPPEFRILKGAEILWGYDGRNYGAETGTLGKGCLRKTECHTHLKFFVDNPQVISLLVAIKGGRVIGKAMLWETDKGTFMDRTYGSDAVQRSFINYAKEQKYFYKQKQSYQDARGFVVNGENKNMTIKVDVRWEGYSSMPYMDTLSYGTQDGLTNRESGWQAQFREPSGRIKYQEEPKFSVIDNAMVVNIAKCTANSFVIFDSRNKVTDDWGNTTHPSLLLEHKSGKKICKYAAYEVDGKAVLTSELSELYTV